MPQYYQTNKIYLDTQANYRHPSKKLMHTILTLKQITDTHPKTHAHIHSHYSFVFSPDGP